MKKRKRIIVMSLLLSIVLGLGSNKINKHEKIQYTNTILTNSQNTKETIIDEWTKALEKSHFSQKEREILIQEFLPYLSTNWDMYDHKSLANLLSATQNTYISYNSNYINETREASYSNFQCNLPFVSCITDGTIILDENYTEKQFLHEYYHSTQGWSKQKHIYAEAYANFCSDGNYDDLYAIFTMLGYLGDKEYLFENLINGTIENYWKHLIELYPNETELINELKKEIETTFLYTYKYNIRLASIQNNIRNNTLDKIKHLYTIKYNFQIENDLLFQVLTSMYLLDKRYQGLNNPLLEKYLVYTFTDNGVTTSNTIEEKNRFITEHTKKK